MEDELIHFEIRRKLFHLCSLTFPLTYVFVTKMYMATALIIITGIVLYLDISRHYNNKIKDLITKIFGTLMREEEASGQFTPSGASYMALGFLLSCLLFSKGLVLVSWLILIVGDCFAAIMGMRFGSPLFNGKSLVGSASFFVSSVFISIMMYFIFPYNTGFFIILFSSLVATLVEFFSDQIKVNDNLSIPLVYCFTTFVLSLL